jgi:hypothetical protein
MNIVTLTASDDNTIIMTSAPRCISLWEVGNGTTIYGWLEDDYKDFLKKQSEDYKYIEQSTDVVDYVAKSLTNITDEERARLIAMLSNP